jgi:hypothetical protein
MNSSEAFAAIGLAAVACDRTLDAGEAAMLRQLLEVRSPYANLGEAVMGAMFDGLLERLLGISQTGLPYIVPGAPDESWLFLKVDGRYRDADVPERGSSMPLGGIPLTTGQLGLLREWIEGLPPFEDATPP